MNNRFLSSKKIIGVTASFIVCISYAYAWTAPTMSPPYGNVVMKKYTPPAADSTASGAWTRVVSNTYAPGPGNRSAQFGVALDPLKPVLGIRVSGYSDDGGVCVASIGNYFIGAVTLRAYLSELNLTGYWTGRAWNNGAGNMATGEWVFETTPAGKYLGAQGVYINTTAYNKAVGVTSIPAGQYMWYSQWYNDGQGGYSNTCYIDVLYATTY